ncbi:hypothetical protein L2E82_29591 [Cichorium intybus]|uniref:Uncharacterized protein n=1 Tax=Cichorium intybus TaxID=13427 RepID=A0ACB9CXY0_CICIN|nr:hypothetical protein L2E82_29591 [Cichorium intybus]
MPILRDRATKRGNTVKVSSNRKAKGKPNIHLSRRLLSFLVDLPFAGQLYVARSVIFTRSWLHCRWIIRYSRYFRSRCSSVGRLCVESDVEAQVKKVWVKKFPSLLGYTHI